jgi:hypothetical protein
MKNKGWRKESTRHSLARKGIKTGHLVHRHKNVFKRYLVTESHAGAGQYIWATSPREALMRYWAIESELSLKEIKEGMKEDEKITKLKFHKVKNKHYRYGDYEIKHVGVY